MSASPLYPPCTRLHAYGRTLTYAFAVRCWGGRSRLARAQASYAAFVREPCCPKTESLFDSFTTELRRNRFYVHESVGGVQRYASRERPVSQWKLETSIWGPRSKHSDARDWYDSEVVRRQMFERDWGLARGAHQLEKFIVASTLEGKEDADGDGIADVIERVEEVIMLSGASVTALGWRGGREGRG